MSLMGTMLVTSETLWPQARWFGLLETALAMNTRLEDQDGLRDRFNEALQQLGIDWASVRHLKLVNRSATDVDRRLDVVLELTDEGPLHRQLSLS